MFQYFRNKCITLLIVACLFILTSCSLPGLSGSSKNTITIGTLNTSESMTVAYIIKGLIEHHMDEKVNIIGNMGSTIVQHQAHEQGEVDITATRYTSTKLPGKLKKELLTNT